MLKKIILTILILSLTIGIVAATDINKLKMPDGFENTGNGMYNQKNPLTNGGTGFNVIINKYTPESFKEWSVNDTDYTVNKTGDLYWYTSSGDDGVIEVFELDGEKYYAVFSATSNTNFNTDKAFEYMSEFNKLNNVKPVTV